MRALVVDLGSTSVRTAVVDEVGTVSAVHRARLTVRSPQPGEVELDAEEIARLVLACAAATAAEAGPCDVVGVANQRASAVVLDRATGAAVGPVIGWQDLRTVVDCLILQSEGVFLAPNQTATKVRWLVRESGRTPADLAFATLEGYVARVLTQGRAHVTDPTNVALTGLVDPATFGWDERVLSALGLEDLARPEIVDTVGLGERATAVAGSPPVAALVGDQQASLFGQGCVDPGHTKITFGTGAMLDRVTRTDVGTTRRLPTGCFPIVARSQSGVRTPGIEGIVLTAGTCVDWLRDDLGIVRSAEETEALATSVSGTDGVFFVPALLGLGTPRWDFGARGAFFGLTRGSGRAHLARAVLEGIAHRGADLIDAADEGGDLTEVRVDGGMSANDFLMQHLADVSGRAVHVSPEREATTRGAGLMALVAADALTIDDVGRMWAPDRTFEPTLPEDARAAVRASWDDVVGRAAATIPELSSVSF